MKKRQDTRTSAAAAFSSNPNYELDIQSKGSSHQSAARFRSNKKLRSQTLIDPKKNFGNKSQREEKVEPLPMKKINYRNQLHASASKHASVESLSRHNLGETPDIFSINLDVDLNVIHRRSSLLPVISPQFQSHQGITVAPAKELDAVWDDMVMQSRKQRMDNPLCIEIRQLPIFEQMTVLVLENHQLENIISMLRPCKNLIGLYLKGNSVITRDLVQIEHLTSLRKLDLSNNGIHFLPEAQKMQRLVNLESLLLHDNLIVGQRQLEILTGLVRLQDLTLQGNPCAKLQGYRKFMADNMPQLRSLDKFIIVDFERTKIVALYPGKLKRQRLMELYRFRPFNEETTSWPGRDFNLNDPVCKSSSRAKDSVESKYSFRKLRQDQGKKRNNSWKLKKTQQSVEIDSQKQTFIETDKYQISTDSSHIHRHLDREFYDLRRRFEYCSPILTQQKMIRMFLTRKKYKAKRKMIKIMAWAIKRWTLRSHLEAYIAGIGLTRLQLYSIGRVRLIQRSWRDYIKRIHLKEWVLNRLQTLFRMKQAQKATLSATLAQFASNENSKKLLFSKSQFNVLYGIGVIQRAVNLQDCEKFSLESGNLTSDRQRLIRRSLLMNLILSSYRLMTVKKKFSSFYLIVGAVKETILLTRVLKKINDKTVSETETDCYASQMSTLRSAKLVSLSRRTSGCNVDGNSRDVQTMQSVVSSQEDSSLLEVTFQSFDDVFETLQDIALYNWTNRERESIKVLYYPFCERLRAMVKIQNWYRSILYRRKLKPILRIHPEQDRFVLLKQSITTRQITQTNTLPKQYILMQAISIKIQRCFRRWTLKSRLNSLILIAKYTGSINTNKLYLEQTIYLHLEHLIHARKLEQRQAFIERGFRFKVCEKDFTVRINYSKQVDVVGRYYQKPPKRWARVKDMQKQAKSANPSVEQDQPQAKSTLPEWFEKLAKTSIPRDSDLIRGVPNKQPAPNSKQKTSKMELLNNIMALIHLLPVKPKKKGKEPATTVVNMSEITCNNFNLDPQMQQARFIKLSFPSVREARNRALVLALLSCDIGKPSEVSFIRLQTRPQFSTFQDAQVVLTWVRRYHRQYFADLKNPDKGSLLAPVVVQMKSPHGGMISKEDVHIRNLLGMIARNEQPSKFERFIVLADADQKDVDNLLGNALKQKKIVFAQKQSIFNHGEEDSNGPLEFANETAQSFYEDPMKLTNGPSGQKETKRQSQIKNMFQPRDKDKERELLAEIKTLQNQKKTIRHGQKDRLVLKQITKDMLPKSDRYFTKVQKIDVLRRKIGEVKKKIADHTALAPDLHQVFTKQVTPGATPYSQKSENKASNSHSKYSNTNARSTPMLPKIQTTSAQFSETPDWMNASPRTQYEYSERMAKQLANKSSVQNQIELLYNEYMEQREAYKAVVAMYSSVLDPIDEDQLEDAKEKEVLREIAEDIRQKQEAVKHQMQVAKKRASVIKSDRQQQDPMMATGNFGSMLTLKKLERADVDKNADADKLEQLDSRRTSTQIFAIEKTPIRGEQSRNLAEQSFNNTFMSTSVAKDLKRLVDLKIKNLHRVQAARSQHLRKVSSQHRREEAEFTQAFVNQSNQIMNITHQAFTSVKRNSIIAQNESSALKVKLQRRQVGAKAKTMALNNSRSEQALKKTPVEGQSLPLRDVNKSVTTLTAVSDEDEPDTDTNQHGRPKPKLLDVPGASKDKVPVTDMLRDKVLAKNSKAQLNICDAMPPLLGAKAVKRLISRSEAQLNPMLSRASQELHNLVSNPQSVGAVGAGPFHQLLRQQQLEDQGLKTDRPDQNKMIHNHTLSRQLQKPPFGMATLTHFNTNKTMLGKTISHQQFQTITDLQDRINAQQIIRSHQNLTALQDQSSQRAKPDPASNKVQLSHRLKKVKGAPVFGKTQNSEPQMVLKQQAGRNRMQVLLSQRLEELTQKREKIANTVNSMSNRLQQSPSNILKLQNLNSERHTTIEQIVKDRFADKDKKRRELRNSDIAQLTSNDQSRQMLTNEVQTVNGDDEDDDENEYKLVMQLSRNAAPDNLGMLPPADAFHSKQLKLPSSLVNLDTDSAGRPKLGWDSSRTVTQNDAFENTQFDKTSGMHQQKLSEQAYLRTELKQNPGSQFSRSQSFQFPIDRENTKTPTLNLPSLIHSQEQTNMLIRQIQKISVDENQL